MKRMGIKGKLILAFLGASLLPLGVISFYSYQKSQAALTNAAFEQVDSVRKNTKLGLDQFFKGVYGQMITLSNSYGVLTAFKDFREGFYSYGKEARLSVTDSLIAKQKLSDYYKNDFGAEYSKQNDGKTTDLAAYLNGLSPSQLILQSEYIADNKFPLGNKHKLDAASANTLYNRTHTIHHPNLREYLEKFGYYDVFLIDAETGDIVYSVFKELDFGTSLKTGPYANSSLAKAFRDALSQTDPTKVSMSDYETYLPSYDAPAGFIASGIFDKGKIIGVLAFQISFDEINKVTLLETTKYKTLETYLVGPDFKMRSDSKVDNAQRNVRASFRNPEKGSIRGRDIEEALKGETRVIMDKDFLGRDVVTSYSPYEVFGHKWALQTVVTQEEAFESVKEMRLALLLGAILVAGLIGTIALWYARSLAEKLTDLASGLREGASTVGGTSAQVAEVSSRLSEASTEQAASLQETVSSIDEISAMVQRNADSASSSLKATEKSTVAAQEGKERVEYMLEAIGDISKENEAIMNSISKSNSEISEIVRVIREIADKTKVINDIVFQTKLLSFNASVEAARAGEHGKGFAVVAEEVGNLASMSGKAATEISEMLDKSVHKVNTIVENTKTLMDGLMKSSKDKVDVGNKTAKECARALDEILTHVSAVNELVAEIATASQEQSSGVREITKAMAELDQVTQSNSSIANESAHTSQDLKEQSERLSHYVQQLSYIVQGNDDQVLEVAQKAPASSGARSKVVSMEKFKNDSPKHTKNSKPLKKAAGAEYDAPKSNDSRFEDI
jgi:methyl-accepting chemotaxis protein